MLNADDMDSIRFFYELEDNHNLKAGELIEFEDGEYSDHQVWHPMRVVKDFNLKEAFDEYIKEHPDQLEDYKANYSMFGSFLVRQGYLDDVENVIRRISLGSMYRWDRALHKKP